jgi:hypothetical protein
VPVCVAGGTACRIQIRRIKNPPSSAGVLLVSYVGIWYINFLCTTIKTISVHDEKCTLTIHEDLQFVRYFPISLSQSLITMMYARSLLRRPQFVATRLFASRTSPTTVNAARKSADQLLAPESAALPTQNLVKDAIEKMMAVRSYENSKPILDDELETTFLQFQVRPKNCFN